MENSDGMDNCAGAWIRPISTCFRTTLVAFRLSKGPPCYYAVIDLRFLSTMTTTTMTTMMTTTTTILRDDVGRKDVVV